MTLEEFERAVMLTRWADSSVAAARLVLVDGVAAAKAGRMVEPEMSRQFVYKVVKSIKAAAARADVSMADVVALAGRIDDILTTLADVDLNVSLPEEALIFWQGVERFLGR